MCRAGSVTPYSRSAGLYVAAGWSPIPMTAGDGRTAKGRPYVGVTGKEGELVTADNLSAALAAAGSEYPDISVRLHRVVGIDVDHGDRGEGNVATGRTTLEMAEMLLGPLPPTFSSTARGWDSGSRIQFYRLPDDVPDDLIVPEKRSIGIVGGYVEIIRFGHRYAKVWPTVHPNGRLYRWYTSAGTEIPDDIIPPVESLPVLPAPWASFLTSDNRVAPERPTARLDSYGSGGDASSDRVFTPAEALHYCVQQIADLRNSGWDSGTRFNDRLNATAFILGTFVPEIFSEDEAREMLYDIIEHHGGTADGQDLATIKSGLESGMKDQSNTRPRMPNNRERTDPFARKDQRYYEGPIGEDTRGRKKTGANASTSTSTRPVNPNNPFDADNKSPDLPGHSARLSSDGKLDIEQADWVRRLMSEIPRLPYEFFDAAGAGSGQLAHLYLAARAARVSPEAMLASHLCEVIAAIPPEVVLPPEDGSRTPASINFFVGFVGPSGAGKNKARDEAKMAVTVRHQQKIMAHELGSSNLILADNGRVWTAKPATSQGINAMYRDRAPGKDQKLTVLRQSVWLTIGEVSSFDAMASGSNDPTGELCEAWSGAALDARQKDKGRYLPLDYMNYRMCMTVGIQPTEAEEFLAKGGVGLPQRIVWVPSHPLEEDSHIDTIEDLIAHRATHPRPGPREWMHPNLPAADLNYSFGGSEGTGAYTLAPMSVPEDVSFEVVRINSEISRGDRDALDAHAALVRLKLAAGFAFMHGRGAVTRWDWDKAQDFMVISDATREAMRRVLAAKVAQKQEAARKAKVADQIAVRDAEESTAEEKARPRVLKKVTERLGKAPEGISWSELKGPLSPTERAVLRSVLESLLALGQVEVKPIERPGQEPGERWLWKA